MKIIFFGSDDFALTHLEALLKSSHTVAACVTQPDRPKGRGMNVAVSPIKECARRHQIPVLQPDSLKTKKAAEDLRNINADIFIVIAYGRFLPEDVIGIPAYGAVNVHASLLPKYRGAAPINWAVINGDTETGISVIRINARMDAGDILSSVRITIREDDTAPSLRAAMMKEGPKLLAKTLQGIEDQTIRPVRQDDGQATFAPKLTKALGEIRWKSPAREILRLIRGLLPWPGAYTRYNGKMLKILEAEVNEADSPKRKPGTVTRVEKRGISVATGSKELTIKKVHLQDANPTDAYQFVIGHALEAGFEFK